MLDFTRFRVLSFDCYGTLIDWESGIFAALRPILAAHEKTVSDSALLKRYAELEATAEKREFRPYREILESVVHGFGKQLEFTPTVAELSSLPNSLASWQPFPDTVSALRRLKSRYPLAIISNVDDALFANTAPKLEVKFDHVITAQQARAYKPSLKIFKLAHERIGIPPQAWLHVAQSVYHDVVPAKSLGITTVWVNRPSPRPGAGAAKAATAQPDLEVPDLRTLAELALPS
jgi:2-haloacid dehalogenase